MILSTRISNTPLGAEQYFNQKGSRKNGPFHTFRAQREIWLFSFTPLLWPVIPSFARNPAVFSSDTLFHARNPAVFSFITLFHARNLALLHSLRRRVFAPLRETRFLPIRQPPATRHRFEQGRAKSLKLPA